MILRIQTLFLLCTAILTTLLCFMPVAVIVAPDHAVYNFYATQVTRISQNPEFIAWNWMSLVLTTVVILLTLFIIFARKKKSKTVRPTLFLQLRLSVVSIVLQAGLLVLLWLQIHQRSGEMSAEWSPQLSFIFPLLGIIFTWLALRGIVKDIALLKSYDRIR